MTITVLDFECMDEETQVAFTEVRAKTAPTPQLAWSQADVEDIDDYIPDHTTRWLGFYVAILIALIAGLAAVWMHESRPTTIISAPTATPVISTPLDTIIPPAPTAAPAPKPAPETPDTQFLALMAQSGWNMAEANTTTMIRAAHDICEAVTEGNPQDLIISALKKGTPEITTGHAIALINNAKTIYCPR